ncbi:IS110 family transposase [Micromonospora sp. LZ34]
MAELAISNDTAGDAQAIAWASRWTPGPRVFFAVEGARSYGIGLARALRAAGQPVVEIVRPVRDNRRRGKGKTDQIDAGLAVLAALRLDIDRLPTPRADGDQEALRILLDARDELTTTRTRRPTDYVPCCSPATTATDSSPAARSPLLGSIPSPAATPAAATAGTNRYAEPKFGGWPARSGTQTLSGPTTDAS